jgi:hypothetical protein
LEWYVRALFSGCAATESAHRRFTYTPPANCTTQRPLLIEPAEGERVTSPASFEWTSVPGATGYELYVDGVRAAATTAPRASGIAGLRGERRWRVRALLGGECAALESAEHRFAIIAQPRGCDPLEAPEIMAPAQISSGVAGRIRWTLVPGATDYVVEISTDPKFARAFTSSTTVAVRQLPFTFTNDIASPVSRYVRVHAVDTKCIPPVQGAFSPVAALSVLPPAEREGVALLTDPTDVHYTLSIGPEFAGQRFTATPSTSWLTITPASGIVPPGGQTLQAVAHSAGLPPGASTASVDFVTAGTAGLSAHGKPPSSSLTLNNVSSMSTEAKSTPPPDAVIIPAVADVKNNVVRFKSDVSVSNPSTQVVTYELNFVPTGADGLSKGLSTTVDIEPGATLSLLDFKKTWIGGQSSTGTLEIRAKTETTTSTSSAPAAGLQNRITFASSRTSNETPSGGTFGQYVPAVPYTNFVPKDSILSMQQIAQSDKYRTNLGLVEGSGNPVTVHVSIYDGDGAKRGEFDDKLAGGEHKQINGVLAAHNIALNDGRIEVKVTGGSGNVTAYASVIDNKNNDPLFVPPVAIDSAVHNKWVVPGVAGAAAGSGSWQTDVRIFNAGSEDADLTLAFYSRNGGEAVTKRITLAAGAVEQLDHVLAFLGIAEDAGALHVTSAEKAPAPARLVVTARTYKETAQGAVGQFIPAVTPEETVAVGSRALQIQQGEESDLYRSNVGFAEVSGKAVTLEVKVFRPSNGNPKLLEEKQMTVELEPYEFRQIDSFLSSPEIGFKPPTHTARISVKAVAGEGRATAYLSLIDVKTGDPTYVPGQ